MKTRLNGEEGYAEIKDGGVMIFNQFTLIACWLLAQLYNCKLFVVCCLYSLSLFAHNNLPKNGSQYGFIIFLCDSEETVKNPIAWRSTRHDRVCQSSLAAECLGLQKAVNHAVFIHNTVSITLKNKVVPIECYNDNSSLNDLLHKTKDPEEKRLLCAMAPIREMIERNEISVELIKSKKMPADILTK